MRNMLLISCLTLMVFCVSASGSVIGIGDFSGSEDLITFDSAPSGTVNGPYTLSSTAGDVTFTSLASNDTISFTDIYAAFVSTPGVSYGSALIDRVTDEPSNLRIEFSSPLFRVGMWLNGGGESTAWDVSILDQTGSIIEAFTFDYGGSGYPRPSIFVGFESAIPIFEVTIVEQSANEQYTGLNDLRMDVVPEPTTLLLLGLGGLILRRKSNCCLWRQGR